MAPLAVDNILFIHGYSVSKLTDYANLPQLLAQSEGIDPTNILLSAFVTLDDEISCDDLAHALEHRIEALETAGRIKLRRTAIIAHSTGAIITRRWMLDRLAKGRTLPSHFISCAGANHGSTLSQLGRTAMAYIFREISQGRSVGRRVLEDLDYGSEFLRRLNAEWFRAWNAGTLDSTFCFSIVGTDHSFWRNQLASQSHENGSDGTVRISGSNLNYRYVHIAPVPHNSATGQAYAFETTTMRRIAAHLIVEHVSDINVAGDRTFLYSHTSDEGKDLTGLVLGNAEMVLDSFVDRWGKEDRISTSVSGIIEGIQSAGEPAYVALKRAMSVDSMSGYDALASEWATLNSKWADAQPDQVCSTVIMNISDFAERPVPHYLTLLRDDKGNARSVSLSLETTQPIANAVDASTMSLYVNYPRWSKVHPHSVRIELYSDTPYVQYGQVGSFNVIEGSLSGEDDPATPKHVVAPNECTYVDIVIQRDAGKAFAFYRSDDPVVPTAKAYPPFPEPLVAVT
jgi:hypothetical protein